jgi:hypothetical protein
MIILSTAVIITISSIGATFIFQKRLLTCIERTSDLHKKCDLDVKPYKLQSQLSKKKTNESPKSTSDSSHNIEEIEHQYRLIDFDDL